MARGRRGGNRGASRQALAINDVENQVPSYAVSEGPAPAAANKDLTEAAVLGSALAAYVLGGAFIEGKHGLSRDPAQARYWLE